MNLDIQFKINSNTYLQSYIRENSHWYKILNRYPERFNQFADEMKEKYKLRTTDKINDFIDKIGMISTVLNTLK
jgi:hypothetical protein